MSLTKIIITPSTKNHKVWNDFNRQTAHPANTTFFASLYSGVLSKPIFLEAYINNQKVSQWLFQEKRSKTFRKIFSSNCGPQILPQFLSHSDDIFHQYIEFLKRESAANIYIHNYALVRGISQQALKISNFRNIYKFSYYLNSLSPQKDIIDDFHSNHKTNTRKAIKDGCIYAKKINPLSYHQLSHAHYKRLKKNAPSLKTVLSICNTLVKNNKALLSGVYLNNQLNAASIVLFHGDNAYYLHGASSPIKHKGATAFLHYSNMKTLIEENVKNYDMGGAVISEEQKEKAFNITDFKRKFGGKYFEAYSGIYI